MNKNFFNANKNDSPSLKNLRTRRIYESTQSTTISYISTSDTKVGQNQVSNTFESSTLNEQITQIESEEVICSEKKTKSKYICKIIIYKLL